MTNDGWGYGTWAASGKAVGGRGDGDGLQPGFGHEPGGVIQGHSGEIGHGIGWFGQRRGVKEADPGRSNSLGSWRGRLRDDGFRSGVRAGDFRSESYLETAAADVDFSGAGTHAQNRRDVYKLCSEALGGLHAPSATYVGSRVGLLREDAPGGNNDRIEVVAVGQLEAALEGDTLGCGGSHATEVRDRNLAAMDGKPHADERRGKRDDDQHQNLGEQAKEANHSNSG